MYLCNSLGAKTELDKGCQRLPFWGSYHCFWDEAKRSSYQNKMVLSPTGSLPPADIIICSKTLVKTSCWIQGVTTKRSPIFETFEGKPRCTLRRHQSKEALQDANSWSEAQSC